MSYVWDVFHVANCQHTNPPKDKFVVIVCEDVHCMGFLVNSRIGKYISRRPARLACQAKLSKTDYYFLTHDSYLDCFKLLPFRRDELVDGRGQVNDNDKAEILRVVAQAKTIEPRYKKLILGT